MPLDIDHTDILPEKFLAPRQRSCFVKRPRLTKTLDQIYQYRFALVSAPAGYGKTTLLVEWMHANNVPASWLRLEGRDNDPIHFINNILLAISRASSGIKQILEHAQPLSDPLASIHAVHYLISVIENLPYEIVLILDDYHEIYNTECHEGVDYLISHKPKNLSLIILTREDPTINLNRWRALGELIEISATELSFTPEEADEFLRDVMGLDLQECETQFLIQLTEGWVTALQLAGLSLKNCANCFELLRQFRGDNLYIAEYLTTEVVNLLPDRIQTFILKTSILEQLNAGLCDALLDEQGSGELLDQIEKRNLFITPLDYRRQWYRYHPLFRDLLLKLLDAKHLSERNQLHQRAACWYQANGYFPAAIEHSFKANDYEKVCELIETCSDKVWARNEMDTLKVWLDAVPNDHFIKHPRLIFLRAWVATLSGQLSEGEKLLSKVEAKIGSLKGNQHRELLGMLKVVRGISRRMSGDHQGAIEISEEGCQLLASDNLNWLAVAQITIGIANNHLGEIIKASQALGKATVYSTMAGNQLTHIVSAAQYARLHITKGSLRLAAQTCRDALEIAGLQGEKGWHLAARAHTSLAHVLTEWNQLKEADDHLKRAIELSRNGDNIRNHLEAILEKSRWLYASQENDQAIAILDQAEALIQEYKLGEFELEAAAYRAQLELYNGHIDYVQEWAEARHLINLSNLSYQTEYEFLTYARLLIFQDKVAEAIQLLEQLLHGATTAGRRGRAIEVSLIKALAYQAQNKTTLASETLKGMLKVTEKEGYRRLYLNEGERAFQLIKSVMVTLDTDLNPYRDYFTSIMNDFHKEIDKPEINFQQGNLEDLTKREGEVLRLLATGLSRTEIAQHLCITSNTVDSHIKSIYAKLNIHNKVEALVAARHYGLTD